MDDLDDIRFKFHIAYNTDNYIEDMKFNTKISYMDCCLLLNNLNGILEDFMNITNRLQANPNDETLLNVARDMLQNMEVELLPLQK